MALKTGMLVGVVGTEDIGVLIQIRSATNTCVIKLNNGTLKKNVPLDDVEEAKDMSDTKANKSPIRLGGGAAESPSKTPSKLASLSVDTRKNDKLKTMLQVGDSVRARCNGGSRWFPGKIFHVHRDGSYDVEYSDGDIEKKMAAVDVELVSKLDKPPLGTSSSRKKLDSVNFAVGDKVKARYNGGKKLFAGKIKRVRSDDTYDILYEDGDEEKRVKAENIEASNSSKAESGEERKPTKGNTSKLTVGKKVKARYKKGKRLFPGKISRVRSDGTYDIDYDDGEIEIRVEANQIEVGDNEDMFADSDDDMKKTSTTKKKSGKWIVGDLVQAYFGKEKKFFTGKIVKVHMNGTYDIKYEDGDSEVRVEASLIENADSDKLRSTKSLGSPKTSSKSINKRPLRVGDAVKAKYKRGAKFFPGKITRVRLDGTYDIKFEDGDVEERVEVDFIQRVDDTDDEEGKSRKRTKKSFEVGDVVKAPFQRGTKLFRGKISRVRSDGTYDIVFDDGDKDTHVPGDLIQPEAAANSSDEVLKKIALKVGDTVKARYKKDKKLFAGTVTRARSDGTYDIKYDNGDVEMRVDIEMIEVPERKRDDADERLRSPNATTKHLNVGDKVRARYNKGSKMFSGEITAVHRDGTYDVRYDDGEKEKDVEAKDIELEEDEVETQLSTKTISKLKVGDLVEANYKNGVKMFPGKISRVHSDGTYDITFNDGDSDRRVPISRIKGQDTSSQRKKTGFTVGDAVKAKYKKGTKYFSGKIARVRSDGTYDVEYEDGDSETRVNASLIVLAEPETSKASGDLSAPALKTKRFEVGDVIKARYKKGTKLFPGKITRVRSDGTYNVRYDDGDTEMSVESSSIEGEEKTKLRDKADEKKPERLAVGDKVNAKYKGGVKMYPGKIAKARLDGTFDVEYDDGDTELRVKSSSIEIIPGSKVKKLETKASADPDDVFGDSDSDNKGKKPVEKKSGSIKVGDIVETNFKLKGKFHRGKIVRARSDGTFDVEYDVGASERHVRVADIKKLGDNQNQSDDSGGEGKISKKKVKSKAGAPSSDSDREPSTLKPKKSSKKPKKSAKKSKSHSSSESSESDRETQSPLQKGTRVTYRKAENKKSQRVGTVRKVHSDCSCDVKYEDGDTSKRISRKLLMACSDSEDSDDDSAGKAKRRRTDQDPSYRRNERVMSNWRRPSKMSKPKLTDKWVRAVVLEKNSDGTYTIRYIDGVVEEDVPLKALKSCKKKQDDSENDGSSSGQRQKRRLRRDRTNGIGTESLFLLEQLAMTLFEEGVLKKKPKLQLLSDGSDTSSSDSSSSSTDASTFSFSKLSHKKNSVDKVLKRLFDSSTLTSYRRTFKENDVKSSGKISRSRIIALVEEFMLASKSTKDSSRVIQRNDDESSSVTHILTEWFATHDDLRAHRHFEFKTLMLAFAYAKNRLGKQRMEQSVATVLEGRFASYHETKRQLELWQQKLGYRLFETLQRHFHDRALPNMIPSRIRVSEVSLIFEQIAREAMPHKPLDVYMQQHQLFPHQTLFLPEFLCCYYQLYGSESSSTSSRWNGAVELRFIAFVASCLFSNGDIVCKRHGDLVRRLSVGRTQAQSDLVLRFREAFESLLSTDADSGNPHDEKLLETSQLSFFAAKVAPDPSILEPAMTLLRKRAAAVSLVEVYASCGFIIDELTSAPTIRNAIEKMRMRVDLAEVRRIIGLIRNICVKILRFPNNADYWRIRADSAAFQQKIGRFDGATSLLEAVGFDEYQKTHFELRGARNMDGKRISALGKQTLDVLKEKCVQLDGELSLFDGVESISSVLERIAKVQESEGVYFTFDECQTVLKHLSAYIENVLKNPKNSRCWRIREANGTFQRQIGYLPHAVELMESIGFDLVPTSNGNVYTLRGTGTATVPTKTSDPETLPSASLANFAFTSVSSQMEWFLWRRKQEIDSLLEDEMRYLHEIVGQFSHAQNTAGLSTNDDSGARRANTSETREAALLKMYPYGTNAIDTFNKSSIQRLQLEMMKSAFSNVDVDQKGFLVEADFARAYGSPSTLPVWSRFDAFDINKDGKVDIADFVAALGPVLDHPYELTASKNGEQVVCSSWDDTDPTLCEVISRLAGELRTGTSCAAAAAALASLINHLYCMVQEPGNASLWSINAKMAIGSKLLRFAACRELLRLVGFREATSIDNDSGTCTRNYELQPQRVRFKTSSSVSELPSSLDTATVRRIQTIASMLAGHHRGLMNPSVSDISAVSRAVANSDRYSDNWIRAVQVIVKCLQNIESEPYNPRYREINTATNTFTKSVGSVKGGSELLLSVGFRETDSGTLQISSVSSLEELQARRLELEVGLGLLSLKATNNETGNSTTLPQKLEQRPRVAELQRRDTMQNKSQTPREGPNRDRPVITSTLVRNPAKKLTKSTKYRPQSARTSTDPIEKEILSPFPKDEQANLPVNRTKARNPGRPTSSALARKTAHNRPLPNRKQGTRTMVLASNIDAGADTILVENSQFVLRGACVRIGAEIRELNEERIVVEVSAEQTLGLAKLRLGGPVRFFHPKNELVSTILVPKTEVTKGLETSENQTLVREVLIDVIANVVDQVMLNFSSCKAKDEAEPKLSRVEQTLVTSFERMSAFPLTSSNVRIGPSMRYIAAWSEAGAGDTSTALSIFRDTLSERKFTAYWEGLVLQSGTSNETVRLGDVKQIIRRNANLSMLLSPGMDRVEVFQSKSEDCQLTYEEFRAFCRIRPCSDLHLHGLQEEEEAILQLPLEYLRKHFQILSQSTSSLMDGFQSVQASQLLRQVRKDIQDHPPVVSEDPLENQAGLELIHATCQQLERNFVGHQRIDSISWPQFVYFVRYNERVVTPEIFPSTKPQVILGRTDVSDAGKCASLCREVAEVVSGTFSSHLGILYFDGSVEVWDLLNGTPVNGTPVQESMGFALFSTKMFVAKATTTRGSDAESDVRHNETFVEAWMDANRTGLEPDAEQVQRTSARIHQFKRSTGSTGALVRFSAWDSLICANSSVLQEPASGSFRFFRLASNFMSPIRQVTIDHVKVELPPKSGKKHDTASSSGVIKFFEVTADGSKVVFLTGSDTIIWIACTGTGAVLCHVNLLAFQVKKFQAFFQTIDGVTSCGEKQTHLYATTSSKSYRHVGMWTLPQVTDPTHSFDRKKVFSFGKAKATTVVHLVVCVDLLFVASREGSIIVWSTATDQTSPIPPLICLHIPLHNGELQSISCQSLGLDTSKIGMSLIQVDDAAAADIDQWETEVLERLDTPPLRFALYLFDDGEIIRLSVADRFDVKLVTLNDPGFEFDVFLAPVSGVEHNQARRVTLQKHRLIRVLFIALHFSRNGIFAQKNIQAFFQDLEKYGVVWKTRQEMDKFALSYQENVMVKLRPFYRRGDGEDVELTQLQKLGQRNGLTQETIQPVVVVGAILKSRANQTQFQTWKFAMNWLRDDVHSEPGQLDHAKRALDFQSSYRFEAERLLRIHTDNVREGHANFMKGRRAALVHDLKSGVRDIIANTETSNDAVDNLLKGVNVFMLEAQMCVDPVENFRNGLFHRAQAKEIRGKEANKAGDESSCLVKLLQAEEKSSVAFGVWLKRIQQEVIAATTKNHEKVTWDWLDTLTCHLEACTLTTAEIIALFVDLGLVNPFTESGGRNHAGDGEVPSWSSLSTLLEQLNHFLLSTAVEDLPLESTMDVLLSPRVVVEFLVEYTNFLAISKPEMTDWWSHVTSFSGDEIAQTTPGTEFELNMREWEQKLRHVALSEPKTEEMQQLQRILRIPLPSGALRVSTITLESRCDTIKCRDRFVMKAIGRLEGGAEFVNLSVLYVVVKSEQNFQEELTFLRKIQHLRVREYFLPACIDTIGIPIIPTADASVNTNEIHYVVVDSLVGWTSLSECVKFMRLSTLPMTYWKTIIWFWGIRVLMALLTMQNEHFTLTHGIDMDMLLVSPDGCDLRMCSLAGGAFVRFGQNEEDAGSLSRSLVKAFGGFIYELLHYVFSDTEHSKCELESLQAADSGSSDEVLCKMSNQLLRLYIDNVYNDEETGEEMERLCELALLALQPPNTRPGLLSLWVYAVKPELNLIAENDVHLKTLSRQMMSYVDLQRPRFTIQKDLETCIEASKDKVYGEAVLRRVVESWVGFFDKLVLHKCPKSELDAEKDTITHQFITQVLDQLLDDQVPHQLSLIVIRAFDLCSKSGKLELGRQAIEILHRGFSHVLELMEVRTSFEQLQSDSLLMRIVLQIPAGLLSIASPQNEADDQCKTGTATNAVLWRLSEPFFREFLAIEMTPSKYPTLLRWFDSRRPPFGFTSTFSVGYEVETSAASKQEIALWWSDHAPLIPQHTPCSEAADELVNKRIATDNPITADYLRCIYETKEIEFKLISGVSVPKFRLAALQQFFDPIFFERKRCYPLVLLRPLPAAVWSDLGFEQLICTLLRDSDEKIVLGALSLLECCTRIFRFDAVRSPRIPNSLNSLAFSCPERKFALQICSQNVVLEVKCVLERTTRALKVLGESGISRASRSQHPLVAILCVGLAWLVNCLYGGDAATQFWRVAGVDQLLVGHCKAKSLPFVNVKDYNMMNNIFRQGQRIGQQDPCKWQVFSSDSSSYRLSTRTCSPFRLMIEEIIIIGSSRAVNLMRTMLQSRTFREESAITEDSSIGARNSAFKRDLISSSDYGKVGHAIDLARDISQLSGTTSEQIQLISYTKALFLHHTTTAANLRVSVFAPVYREIWSWMETAWRTIALHSSSSKQSKTDVKLLRAHGDILIAGFGLLHSIMIHTSIQIEHIAELTTFDSADDEMANILHNVVAWIMDIPCGVSRHRGSILNVLVESVVELLTNFVRTRKYHEVALEIVDTRLLLQVLEMNCTSDDGTIVSIGEKQQIWSMLLYFDSRVITVIILETHFLDFAVSSLLDRDMTVSSAEDQIDILNRRLEAVMFLEVLVFAASRRAKSVNTHLLFAEVCKLLLHHKIIVKEAQYLRKMTGSSSITSKNVAVSKRVMQLICCLCVDFSSQKASRVFLEHLDMVGIPAWVVVYHQDLVKLSYEQLSIRIELFWKDWQGCGEAGMKPAMMFNTTNKTKSEKEFAQISPRCQKTSGEVEIVDSDDESVEMKLGSPLASVSPVKPASHPTKVKAAATRSKIAGSKKNHVIHTLLGIDADSALRLRNKSRVVGQKQSEEEELDSEAYSPLSGNSSSEYEMRARAQRKTKRKKTLRKSAKDERKLQNSSASDSSSANTVARRDRRKSSRKRAKPAAVQNQKEMQDALRAIFFKYDVDGDGSISFIDLRRAMDKQMTHRLSDLEIQRWITEKDRSGQGVVGFDDFVVAFESQVQL